MKVHQLIKELGLLDPNAEVTVGFEQANEYVSNVESVEVEERLNTKEQLENMVVIYYGSDAFGVRE